MSILLGPSPEAFSFGPAGTDQKADIARSAVDQCSPAIGGQVSAATQGVPPSIQKCQSTCSFRAIASAPDPSAVVDIKATQPITADRRTARLRRIQGPTYCANDGCFSTDRFEAVTLCATGR